MRGCCSGAPRSSGSASSTVQQAQAAPLELLDYVAIGGVYGTTSKDNTSTPIGVAGLRAIVQAVRARKAKFPICAIAGINAEQRRRGNRGRRRRRGGDLGAVAARRDPAQAARRSARGGGRRAHAARAAMTAIAVTIAGSDSSGGAGIQADLKTFAALGVYGASVITALTAQNTQGVTAIHDVPAGFRRGADRRGVRRSRHRRREDRHAVAGCDRSKRWRRASTAITRRTSCSIR